MASRRPRSTSARGRHQQPVPDPAAGHRGHLEDLLGQLADGLDAAQEHVGQGVGQGDVGPDGAGRDQLLGEERVALGAGQDPVDHGRRDRVAGDRLEVLGQLEPVEGGELDALQVGDADQLGQQRAQGVAAVQLVGPVAGHQGDPAAAQGPDQEGQQVAGGAVGPVQVLDDQQQRGQLGQADQQRQHPVEQLDPFEAVPGRRRRTLAGGHLGQQPAQAGQGRGQGGGDLGLARAGAEVAEGVDEGHVREADVADLHAAADQHPDAAALGPGGELGQQPGLADAGVAGDQPDRRPATLGPVEQAEQALELLGPADEAAGGCGGHAGKYGAPADSTARGSWPAHLRTRPPCITKGTSASSSRWSRGSSGTAMASA
jgi:hypothetical protein